MAGLSSTIKMRRPTIRSLVAGVMSPLGRVYRQHLRERGAAVGAGAFGMDRPAELARGVRTRVEAETVATLLRREPVVEHAGQVLGRDPDARVVDDDRDAVVASLDPHRQLAGRALRLPSEASVR